MTRCEKCGTRIRKLAGNPGKGSRWGCRRCLGILRMRGKLYSMNGHLLF
jgi:hypothetical protein